LCPPQTSRNHQERNVRGPGKVRECKEYSRNAWLKTAIDIDIRGMQRYPVQGKDAATVFHDLLRLDSGYKPGLTIHDFMGLFSICSKCQLVMTKRVVRRHLCEAKTGAGEGSEIEYIDLTADEV
jgi:hypothetical protein